MKIIQAVGWFYPDSIGGTEVYVAALAGQLRACGHEVVVAAPEPGARAPREYDFDGLRVFRYPVPEFATREEAQGDVVVRGAEHLHRFFADAKADVVHIHTFVTGLGLPEILTAKRAGSRVIATTHSSSLGFLCQRGTLMWHGREICDGIVEVQKCAACELEHRGASPGAARCLAAVPAVFGGLARQLSGRLGTALSMTDLIVRNGIRQRAMLAAVDAFVVLTKRAADMVIANGAPANKIVVNRLGVRDATAEISERPARQPVRIGYLGRFDPIKGVLDLVNAVHRVPRHVPLHVELRGPAQTPADIETRTAIAAMIGDDSRITLGAAVPPSAVMDVIRTYDVVCCPSRCLEGGPTVGLEALAARVPVITASVGGVAEMLEDGVNGRLVPPGDVGRLAAALVEVAGHPEETIDKWRRRLPPPRTMRDVAHEYLALYGTH